MKAHALSFVAALLFHGAVLFCIRLGSPSSSLAISDEQASVDVDLAAAAPPGVEAAATPEPPAPAPSPAPEPPAPAPSPAPEAAPAPEPTPAPQAAPSPAPAAEQPTPAPQPQPAATAEPHPAHASAGRTSPGLSRAGKHSGEKAGAFLGIITTAARERYTPKPEYPLEAQRQHETGTVLLSVDVGKDGLPKEVSLKKSTGFPLLDQSALQRVRRQWTFWPATVGGLPVDSPGNIVPITFASHGG